MWVLVPVLHLVFDIEQATFTAICQVFVTTVVFVVTPGREQLPNKWLLYLLSLYL